MNRTETWWFTASTGAQLKQLKLNWMVPSNSPQITAVWHGYFSTPTQEYACRCRYNLITRKIMALLE